MGWDCSRTLPSPKGASEGASLAVTTAATAARQSSPHSLDEAQICRSLTRDSAIIFSSLFVRSGLSLTNPAGEAKDGGFRLDFDRRVMLQFRGSVVTSDAGSARLSRTR